MKKVLMTAALMVASSSSFAAGGYAGVEIGWSSQDQEAQARETAQYLANASGNTVNYTYDTGVAIGRIYGGWKGDSNLGVEVGYFQSGDLNSTYNGSYGGSAATVTTDVSASGLDLSALYWVDESVYLKAGMHSSKVEGTVNATVLNGSASYSAEDSGTGWLIGAGYEGAVSDAVNWRASYSYYGKLGGESDNDAHVFSVGIGTKF